MNLSMYYAAKVSHIHCINHDRNRIWYNIRSSDKSTDWLFLLSHSDSFTEWYQPTHPHTHIFRFFWGGLGPKQIKENVCIFHVHQIHELHESKYGFQFVHRLYETKVTVPKWCWSDTENILGQTLIDRAGNAQIISTPKIWMDGGLQRHLKYGCCLWINSH